MLQIYHKWYLSFALLNMLTDQMDLHFEKIQYCHQMKQVSKFYFAIKTKDPNRYEKKTKSKLNLEKGKLLTNRKR